MRRRLCSSLLALVAIGALAGCGSKDDGAKPPAGGAAEATAVVTAADFSLSPAQLTIPTGDDTISVRNEGKIEHNLTIEALGVDQDVEAGKASEVKLTAKAGTYPFFCKYHPGQMKGTLTVG